MSDRATSVSSESFSSPIPQRSRFSESSVVSGRLFSEVYIRLNSLSGDNISPMCLIACKTHAFATFYGKLESLIGVEIHQRRYIPLEIKEGENTKIVYVKVSSLAKRILLPESFIRYQLMVKDSSTSVLEDVEDMHKAFLHGRLDPLSKDIEGLKNRMKNVFTKALEVKDSLELGGSYLVLSSEEGSKRQNLEGVIHKNAKGEIQITVSVDSLSDKGSEALVYRVYDVAHREMAALRVMRPYLNRNVDAGIMKGLQTPEVSIAEAMMERKKQGGSLEGLQEFMGVDIHSISYEDGVGELRAVKSRVYEGGDAESLKAADKKGKLHTVPKILSRFASVIFGANILKSMNFIHLDIKLGNIFCSKDGKMHLGDLGGVARVGSVKELLDNDIAYSTFSTSKSDCDRLNALQEKLEVPEKREVEDTEESLLQEFKELADKVSVFQLGVALYQLLQEVPKEGEQLPIPYGREEYGFLDPTEESWREVTQELNSKLEGVPALAEVISFMLHPDPAKRPDMDAVQAAFKKYLDRKP